MLSKLRTYNPKLLFIYVCLICAVLGMEAGGLQYNLLLISDELGLNSTQMGNIVSMQYLAFILIPLAFGGLGDRHGKKVIMVSFGLCFCLGCLSIISAQNFWMVLASVFLLGAGYSICESTGTALLSDIYHEDSSRYINWSQSVFSIGALISPLLCQWLCDRAEVTWRGFFVILLVICLAVSIWAMWIHFPGAIQQKRMEPKENTDSAGKITKRMLVCVLLLAFCIMIYAGMETGIAFFMGSHVSGALGTESYNSLTLSLFWLMMIPSRYLVGLAKKYSKKILIGVYLGAALCIGIVMILATRSGLIAGYAFMGFFFAPIWPLIMGEAGNLDPENSARISGIMVAFCGLGGVIAPTMFGYLADQLSIQASLLFVFGITMAGFVMAVIYNIMVKKLKVFTR